MRQRLATLWRRRPALALLSVVTLVTLVCWPIVDFYLRIGEHVTPFGFNDFSAYAGAVHRWNEGGPVYQVAEGGGYHGSYLYPPVTLLVFYPFATFEFVTGAVLLGGVSLIVLWLGLEAVADVYGVDLGFVERGLLLVALFGFQPALRSFKWAQIPTFFAGVLCFAFYAQERGAAAASGRWWRYAAGALTTVASAFKLFVATSGAHLLRDRQRLFGATVTAVGLAVASFAIFGVETHEVYLDVLTWGKGWGETVDPYRWDPSAAYHPIYALEAHALWFKGLGVLAVIGLVLATRGDASGQARQKVFALGVAVVPLLAPSADSHDLVLLLVPATILFALEFQREDGYPVVPVLAVLLLHFHRYVLTVLLEAPGRVPLGSVLHDHIGLVQPGLWATLLLVGLAAWRVAEHADLPPLGGRAGRGG